MTPAHNKAVLRGKQEGALILVTLLILLVVSLLGMSSVDSTGLEMRMSSNSREQQQAFEAAEYTLSWAENNIATTGYFTPSSLTNDVDGDGGAPCGALCFSSTCTNGYCFNGVYPILTPSWSTCALSVPATEPYADPAVWATGSGKHRILVIPNTTISAKFIVEFWCYGAPDETQALSLTNNARMYRITAYTIGESGRGRVMLRSTVMEL